MATPFARPCPTALVPWRRLGLLLAVLLLAGCDDPFIDPFENDSRFFTVYGFLDQLETRHQVRVIPVTRIPERILTPTDGAARIDAVVTSFDLTTGDSIRWQHTLEKLDDGFYGHIFRASFIVQPGRRYRLEVRRNDGTITWAETRVPVIPHDDLFELGPFRFSADSAEVTQEVYVPNMPSLWDVQAIYMLGNPIDLNTRFLLPKGQLGAQTDDGGWRFTLNLTADQEPLRDIILDFRNRGIIGPNSQVALTSMGAQIRLLDENWNPPGGGVFDPEVLAQPGAHSNVENGYGRWGAVGIYRQQWTVPPEIANRMSY